MSQFSCENFRDNQADLAVEFENASLVSDLFHLKSIWRRPFVEKVLWGHILSHTKDGLVQPKPILRA